ncbi:TIGR02206 family membrane protein [Halobacillus litoralis]|uniref:YwaF family protein n=1 Tax=Halobacillus litoralis TaxID=45668 RepID=UPI001CD7CDEC|nr:TIGR02206 family membrane protein [Halobacillus litoralis]MCA0970533.1 TIGR02206 family membrane protein [Halobacillus litoralis]
MPSWFDTNVQEPFQFFSTSHIIMLSILFSGIVLLLIVHNVIRKNVTLQRGIKWSIFSLLFVSEAGHQIWGLANQNWNMEDHAPFHLCGNASLLAMIALLRPSKRLIQLIYFAAVLPAIITLLTPEVFYSFPHFRFLKFFLHHMALAWAGIFLVITTSTEISFKSLLHMFGVLNLYAAFIFVLNRMIGTNYLFLAGTPDVTTPLSALGDGVWYYINLELFCFAIFLVMYGFYRLGRRWSRSNETVEEEKKSVNF